MILKNENKNCHATLGTNHKTFSIFYGIFPRCPMKGEEEEKRSENVQSSRNVGNFPLTLPLPCRTCKVAGMW